MSVFKVRAEHLETSEVHYFYVDNKSLLISEAEFPYGGAAVTSRRGFAAKKPPYSNVRIQLGLKCNFSCGYCQQQNLADEKQFSLEDIGVFIEKFVRLEFSECLRIQFWGGEPLVYWKYIKQMMPEIKKRLPQAHFGIITNGALVTKEVVDACLAFDCNLSISHDGPGQETRGDDPIDFNRENIEYALEKLLPTGRFSFNTMISPKNNPSRLAVIEFFKTRFPKFHIPSGEMGVLKTTSKETHEFVKMTKSENFEFRRNLWAEMRFHSKVHEHCRVQSLQVSTAQASRFIMQSSLEYGKALTYSHLEGQKCGMDRPDQIAVDLEGNVLTCHNTSRSSVSSFSDKTHVIGNLFDDKPVVITEARPWADREHCMACPVFALCHGSCMLLSGEEWDLTCELEYAEKITHFAIGFEQVTGYVPVEILDDTLPLHRRDIWGSLYTHEDQQKHKVIPIVQVP